MTSTLLPPDLDVDVTAEVLRRDDVVATPPPRPSRVARLWRGPSTDPAWARPALLGLLALTAVLYLWGLGASGWANSYYSAAVQAGTKSWKAFFFGSTDSSNFITVDKTPASLWVMGLSARVFGVNAWSILVPQALEGVAAVGLLVATVKRWSSPVAGLVAGAVFALTPVAVLMFRFNNPDALLVLLLVAAAYAMTRAIESGRTRWLVLTGAAVGFGFLAKELQAFLVLPGLAAAYLIAGPPRLRRRIGQLATLGVSMVVSAGWWIAIVSLWPASDRPYIGGSQNNSFWNVLFGYNGLGRLTGSETGSVGGGGGQTGQWGATGWSRLFNSQFGGQASWLIPAALILLVAGAVFTWRRPRTDRVRAALVIWGGWLLLTGAAISFGQGIIHPYYTVALAPAIGALVGIGGWQCWQRRDTWFGRGALAAAIGASTLWAAALLSRSASWLPWLRTGLLALGVVATIAVLVPRLRTKLALGAVGAGLIVMLAAPAAYSLSTAASTHSGALPSAGPAVAGAMGRPGGPGQPGAAGGTGGPGGTTGANTGFAPPSATGTAGNQTPPQMAGGTAPSGTNRGAATGGMGGLLNGSTVGKKVTAMLQHGATGYRWVAAAVGANNAGSYQLASGEPVMAIGGFNGSDPAPTLAQFKAYVRAGAIHYFIGGQSGGGGNSSGSSNSIATWVAAHFTVRTVNGATIYDLTNAK